MSGVKRKFLLTVFSLILLSLHANGQSISVSSFKLIENDLTANTTGTMERDQNGETAALIKVVTSETGFSFDGGMVGIVKAKQEVGEIWVYVPHGIKKMSIRHPQLGVLRDYYFPISVDKARTYEMVITTGKVQTIVNQSLKKQFVIFTVTPKNATLEFDGETLELDETGYAEIGVPYGSYSYRVSCPDYHTSAGTLEVKDGFKPEVNIDLTPNFGWIEVNTAPDFHGANIYIDGKKVGTAPLAKKQMKSGDHKLKMEKPLYKDYESMVTIEDGKLFSVEVAEMQPNFANVELVVDEKSEIWVDGELKGTGKWNGALEIGDHSVETRQISHLPSSETVRIFDAEPRVIQLKQPTPLYSSMEITSVPSRAKVFIDGVEVGMTPMVLNEVLIGMRELAFEKEGYDRHIKRVTVNYGMNSTVKAILADPSDEPLPVVAAETQPEQQPEQQPTPVPATVNEVTTEWTVEEGEPGIILNMKHPSDYGLYINKIHKADFSGDQYDLGNLNPGKYDVKVNGKKYVGHKRFEINETTSELYLKTKRRNNYFHSNMSVYAGVGYAVAVEGVGLQVGGYIKGINAEFNWASSPLGPASSDYRDWGYKCVSQETQYDFCLGYGFKVNRNWLITPQIGYYSLEEYYYYYLDIFNENGYGVERDDFDESDIYSGLSLACRVQYCFLPYVSLNATIGYLTGDWDEAVLNLGVIFTFPFTKK